MTVLRINASSETLSRIQSLADYTIAMLESSFRKRQGKKGVRCQAPRSVSSLPRLTSGRGFRNFYEFSRFHVVDIAVYRNVIGNQWVASDPDDILDHALRVVGECYPVDVVAFCRP